MLLLLALTACAPSNLPKPDLSATDTPIPSTLIPTSAPPTATPEYENLRKQLDSQDVAYEIGDDGIYITVTGKRIRVSIGAGDFIVKEVNNLLYNKVIGIKDTEGQTYLWNPDTSSWFEPNKIQYSPEDIGAYTSVEDYNRFINGNITLGELWDEKVSTPFPEGTFVPKFFLNLSHNQTTFYSYLNIFPNYPNIFNYYQEIVGGDYPNKNNTPFKWVAFYKTKTPDGLSDVVVATLKILDSDGKSFILEHFAFGDHWLTDLNNQNENVLVRELTKMDYNIFPIIFGPPGSGYRTGTNCSNFSFQSQHSQPSACKFLNLPNNDPAALFSYEQLEQKYKENLDSGKGAVLGPIENPPEIQNMILLPGKWQWPAYYFHP